MNDALITEVRVPSEQLLGEIPSLQPYSGSKVLCPNLIQRAQIVIGARKLAGTELEKARICHLFRHDVLKATE